MTLLQLPPTSYSIQSHILRAWYNCHMQLNCLENPHLDARNFGYEEDDCMLVPSINLRIKPDDLPRACTCGKCATKRCLCRKAGISCCIYCGCRLQNYQLDNTRCQNPNLVLRVPVTIPRHNAAQNNETQWWPPFWQSY